MHWITAILLYCVNNSRANYISSAQVCVNRAKKNLLSQIPKENVHFPARRATRFNLYQCVYTVSPLFPLRSTVNCFTTHGILHTLTLTFALTVMPP